METLKYKCLLLRLWHGRAVDSESQSVRVETKTIEERITGLNLPGLIAGANAVVARDSDDTGSDVDELVLTFKTEKLKTLKRKTLSCIYQTVKL